jgi:hypothetical protein
LARASAPSLLALRRSLARDSARLQSLDFALRKRISRRPEVWAEGWAEVPRALRDVLQQDGDPACAWDEARAELSALPLSSAADRVRDGLGPDLEERFASLGERPLAPLPRGEDAGSSRLDVLAPQAVLPSLPLPAGVETRSLTQPAHRDVIVVRWDAGFPLLALGLRLSAFRDAWKRVTARGVTLDAGLGDMWPETMPGEDRPAE